LKEFIQTKVYETLQTYLRDLEQYQFENQETVNQLIMLRAQVDREKSEKESFQRQLREARDDARRKIDSYERRSQELEADNTAMHAQLRSNEAKMKKTNDLNDKLKSVENDKVQLDSRIQQTDIQLMRANEMKQEAERRNE
jgi:hypothetical protein